MDLFIISSKHFYERIPPIQVELENYGHNITLPNSYDDPFIENRLRAMGRAELLAFKQEMMRMHEPKVMSVEGVLALNFEKNG